MIYLILSSKILKLFSSPRNTTVKSFQKLLKIHNASSYVAIRNSNFINMVDVLTQFTQIKNCLFKIIITWFFFSMNGLIVPPQIFCKFVAIRNLKFINMDVLTQFTSIKNCLFKIVISSASSILQNCFATLKLMDL